MSPLALVALYALKWIGFAIGLCGIAGGIAGGIVLVWRELHHAPIGREDAAGFHKEFAP